jgi:Fe-S-cluster containining protein
MSRAERRRQDKLDRKLVERGFDPSSRDPRGVLALSRHLSHLAARAKLQNDVDILVKPFHATISKGSAYLSYVPVACKKGCSHCCNIRVSASAPEILSLAKIVRSRGGDAVEAVVKADQLTRKFSFEERPFNPNPCPLLKDHLCSVYECRPSACRLAASGDAAICERSYNNVTDEDIAMPAVHLLSRATFSAALAMALKYAGLPHQTYELNSGLARALERKDSEKAWLSGEDIFAGTLREAGDFFDEEPARIFFAQAPG